MESVSRPAEVTRTLSLPPVSTVNVSAAGNLMAVLVSPVWIILSAIDTSLLAVIIPTESILVTSSYVNVPPTDTLPVNVAATPTRLLIVIFGVPVNPVALPVRLPLKLAAVAIPVILIPPAPVNPTPATTYAPKVSCGAPLAALLTNLSALILDILWHF